MISNTYLPRMIAGEMCASPGRKIRGGDKNVLSIGDSTL